MVIWCSRSTENIVFSGVGAEPTVTANYIKIQYERNEVIAMSNESFKARVNALIRRSKQDVSVDFNTDEESGKYYANCSDGTTIIGRPHSLKVTVKWGSGHTSMATI